MAASQEIRLGKLNTPAENPRKTYAPASLAKLRESLDRYGILVPIVVRRLNRSEYAVIDGGTRVRLARELGWSPRRKVPAHVVELDDQEALAASVVVNQVRERLSKRGELDALRSLVGGGLSHEGAAAALGRSQAWATKMLSIDRLPAKVRRKVDRGELAVSHAIEIARFAARPDIVTFLMEQALTGRASVRALRRMGEAASEGGVRKAKRRRPRDIKLTGESWARLRPVADGTRIELHVSAEDSDDAILEAFHKLLAKR